MQAAWKNLATLTGTGEGAQGMLFLMLVLAALLLLAAERRAEAAERRAEALVAERRAEAAARSTEAALCYINVRRWDGHTSAVVKLRLSFAHFRAEALGAVRVAGQARLYTVRGDRWQERQPLTDATYAALLRSALDGGDVLIDVLVFQPLPGADASPDKAPVDAQEAPPRDALAARARGGDEASSGRSSAVQSKFRAAILRRDGKACVLCRSSSSLLEAAHVIPRTAGLPLLLKAGLLTANYALNGILLCVPCHRLYDAFMWCLDPASGIVVADALLCDATLGEEWKQRVGAQLCQPADAARALHWPPPSAWAASLGLFHDARASATFHTPSAQRRRASMLRRRVSGGGGGEGGGAENIALVEDSEDEDSGAADSDQ